MRILPSVAVRAIATAAVAAALVLASTSTDHATKAHHDAQVAFQKLGFCSNCG